MLLLSILFASAFALPATPTRPVFNVEHPGSTPAHLVPLHSYELNQLDKINLQRISLNSITSFLGRRDTSQCIGSTGSASLINNLFLNGGASTQVFLCPSAVINITDSIVFTAQNQVLATLGYPTDSTRARIVVTGVNQTNSIYAPCDQCSGVQIRSLVVDGNREGMGWMAGASSALIEMGGNAQGQTIRDSHVYEPRGWSCLHGIEGYQNSCRGLSVINNQIGPSGHAPTTGLQFKKRDSTGMYNPGQWADGISLACGSSTVSGNTVTDATDGAIVIFGAENSVISGNTIISSDRQLLGGINMVDFWPYAGSFNGIQVTSNTIIAAANFIKVGIAVGSMTWGSDNATADQTFGGKIYNNVLQSGQYGYFGYGISVGGHHTSSFLGNDATGANFGGEASNVCRGIWTSPVAFVNDPYTTPNVTVQPEFLHEAVNFMICNEPGAIAGHGYFAKPPPSNSTSPTGSAQQVPAHDLALSAIATASSNLPNQEGSKAIDGTIGGVVQGGGDYTREWASNYTKQGAWILLTWSSPIAIGSVVLYDRPNLSDHVTAGLLTFGDGTTIRVPALVNDGSASPAITFPTIVTNSLRFTVTGCSSYTIASGLSEIVVYGPSSNSTVTPTGTKNSTSTVGPTSSAIATSSVKPTSATITANSTSTSTLSKSSSTLVISSTTSTSISKSTSTLTSSTSIKPVTSSSTIAASSSTITPVKTSTTLASSSATPTPTFSFTFGVERKVTTTVVKTTTTTVVRGQPTPTKSTSTQSSSTTSRSTSTPAYAVKQVATSSSPTPSSTGTAIQTVTYTSTMTITTTVSPAKATTKPRGLFLI